LSRILLDHNLALDLRDLLSGHDVRHAVEMGWHQIGNGELLTIAEAAGFEIVITADPEHSLTAKPVRAPLVARGGIDQSLTDASLLSHAPSFRATSVSSVSILLSLAV
jgi:hypothetical protein